MTCLGLEPGVAGWKAQVNPLSYGDTLEANNFGNGNPDGFI